MLVLAEGKWCSLFTNAEEWCITKAYGIRKQTALLRMIAVIQIELGLCFEKKYVRSAPRKNEDGAMNTVEESYI